MVGVVAGGVAGIALGLSLAAPPGPMNAIIAEESVARGFRAGVGAGLGAMSADACFLVLAWIGAATVLQGAPRLQGAILAVGGVLLFVLAFDAVRDARRFTSGPPAAGGRGFLKAFSLSLTNPYQLLWWLTVGVALLDPGVVDLSVGPVSTAVATGTPAMVVGFFVGIGLWITAFPLALVRAGRRIDGLAPLVAAGSGVVLAGFGVVFLYRAISLL